MATKNKETSSASPEKYKCTGCGKSFLHQSGNFNVTKSPLFKANNGYVTICKKCRDTHYDKLVELYEGNENEAIESICQVFDWYYQPDAIVNNQGRAKNKLVRYISVLNLPQNTNKGESLTYLDTIKDSKNRVINSIEDVKVAQGENIKITKAMFKTWGAGHDPEDYPDLEGQLSDWRARYPIDGDKTRVELVKQLCINNLHQRKALKADKIDVYNKLVDSYQKTLDRASLTPKITDKSLHDGEKPLGVMIGMFEKERPITKKYEGTNQMIRFFTIYCLGHLCKMLGFHNKYEDMYEEEMNKYRVEIDELSDAEDEDIFDFITRKNAERGSGDVNE